MTSLYNRATPAQRKVLRIIEGAVRNADHAHKLNLPARVPKSIAKRATGTLTAVWPDVLASATRPASEGDAVTAQTAFHRVGEQGTNTTGRAAKWESRPSIYRVRGTVSNWTGQARRAGNVEREQALIDVLRLIAEVVG